MKWKIHKLHLERDLEREGECDFEREWERDLEWLLDLDLEKSRRNSVKCVNYKLQRYLGIYYYKISLTLTMTPTRTVENFFYLERERDLERDLEEEREWDLRDRREL